MDDAYGIVEKNLDPITVCSIRYRGKYSDFGIPFGELFRKIGRYARGAPFALYHDGEYREDDADMEVAVAVSRPVTVAGIECRILEGARVVSLRYRGPYDGIGVAYRRVFEYIGERGYEAKLPSRELYLKGPGMILPRSPKNFVTEIQIPV
jgi:effector-binding domain-containing protein